MSCHQSRAELEWEYNLQRISSRAIIGLRQRRYLRQDNLDYSTLVLRISTHRLGQLRAVQK
jgi:hypothetical protein